MDFQGVLKYKVFSECLLCTLGIKLCIYRKIKKKNSQSFLSCYIDTCANRIYVHLTLALVYVFSFCFHNFGLLSLHFSLAAVLIFLFREGFVLRENYLNEDMYVTANSISHFFSTGVLIKAQVLSAFLRLIITSTKLTSNQSSLGMKSSQVDWLATIFYWESGLCLTSLHSLILLLRQNWSVSVCKEQAKHMTYSLVFQ